MSEIEKKAQSARGKPASYGSDIDLGEFKLDSPDYPAQELKEIDMLPSGERLWQVGQNRPLENVTITEDTRRRGFVPVGRLTIDKSGSQVAFAQPRGYFDKKLEPAEAERYGPVFRGGPAAVGPARVVLDQ